VPSRPQQRTIACAAFVLSLACLALARAAGATDTEYLTTLSNMVAVQAPRSAVAAAAIRDVYEPYVDALALPDFVHIEEALATGGLVLLPHPEQFNVRLRLDGTNPIAEKDIAHQASYISARPATIGCLIDVASRVKTGPLEITSLVRHLDYQQQLLTTNANAATAVPTHALGLAFDIAMVNTPLETVLEIRDVLQRMSDAGDILVIVERQQLVFHVVPQPSRLGWYAQVYSDVIAGRSWARRADADATVNPVVTTAVGSIRPLPAWAAEWWAAENVPVDLPMALRDDGIDATTGRRGVVGRCLTFVSTILAATWQKTWSWSVAL